MRSIILFFLLTLTAAAYFPPKGVPRPLWGALDPINETTPAQPGGWPSTPVTNYYYVDDDHGSATDTANTYGTPDLPRLTVPSAPAAGSVIFIESLAASRVVITSATGTEANPIWIVGTGSATVDILVGGYGADITGSDYIIVDGITFDGADTVPNGTIYNRGVRVKNGCDYVTFRNGSVINTAWKDPANGNTGSVCTVTSDTSNVSNVIFYNFDVIDCGGYGTVSEETGAHGYHFTQGLNGFALSDVMVIDCEIARSGEDNIQIGETNSGMAHADCTDIWIVDSRLSQAFENAIDLKCCENIYVIESRAWGYGSQLGAIVGNDEGGTPAGPGDTFFIRNEISDCRVGIRIGSAHGTHTLIGNVIHGVYLADGDSYPTAGSDPVGVGVRKYGASNFVGVNNTFYDIPTGITCQAATDYTLTGNIFYDFTDHTQGRFAYTQGITGTVVTGDNYFFDPDGTPSGASASYINSDPLLIAPAAGLFGLQSGSPCIGAGSESASYDAYFTLTGESIEYDFDERIRDGWDVGAFEYIEPLEDKLSLALNDVIIFGGDSITAANLYSHFWITWLQGMYPDLNLKTYNIARSGSSLAGWQNFQPGTSSSGLYARYHYLGSPDVVFMMHGQNGGDSGAQHGTYYQELWDDWNDVDGTLDTNFTRLVSLGMHPVQTGTDTKSAESKADAEATQASAEANWFASDTFDWIGDEWIANAGNEIDIQTSGTFVTSGDNVHPNEAGNFVILIGTLMGLEAEKDVSAVAIDASAGTELDSYRATVGSLSASTTSVSFTRLDESLPYAINEAGRADAERLYRKCKNWQRYLVRVANLAAGTYSLKIDDVEIGQYSDAELNNGVNLSDMTSGPVWDHLQETLGEVRDLQRVSRTTGFSITTPSEGTYRYFARTTTEYQNSSPADLAAYSTAMAGDFAAQDDEMLELTNDAEPVTMTWTVTQVSAPPASGGTATATSATVGTLNIGN